MFIPLCAVHVEGTVHTSAVYGTMFLIPPYSVFIACVSTNSNWQNLYIQLWNFRLHSHQVRCCSEHAVFLAPEVKAWLNFLPTTVRVSLWLPISVSVIWHQRNTANYRTRIGPIMPITWELLPHNPPVGLCVNAAVFWLTQCLKQCLSSANIKIQQRTEFCAQCWVRQNNLCFEKSEKYVKRKIPPH